MDIKYYEQLVFIDDFFTPIIRYIALLYETHCTDQETITNKINSLCSNDCNAKTQ